MRVRRKLKGQFGDALDLAEGLDSDAPQAVCRLLLVIQLPLLALELLERHRFGRVRVKELVALLVDRGEPSRESPHLLVMRLTQRLAEAMDGGSYLVSLRGGQLDGPILALHRILDCRGSKVPTRTSRPSADAEEVGVFAAVASSEVEDQPTSAVPAEHAALEVVVVRAPLLASGGVSPHHRLDALERGVVDQRRMIAVVVDLAAERDLAEVVLAAEQLVELVGFDLAGVASP